MAAVKIKFQPFLVPVHGTNYRRTLKLGHFGNSLLLSASLRTRNAHTHARPAFGFQTVTHTNKPQIRLGFSHPPH